MADTTTMENSDNPSTPLTDQAKQKAQQTVDQVKQKAQQAADQGQQAVEQGQQKVEQTVDQGKQQAQQVVQQGRQKAGQIVDKVRDQVKTQLTTQKDRLAQEIDGVAQVIRLSSAQLENQGHAGVGHYAEQAAERLTQFSQEIGGKQVEELVADTENFARSRPALFLGGAALLGVMAARFWKSSAADAGQTS